MTYKITLTHDPAELHRCRDEWITLQENSPTDTIFLTWEWVVTWWDYFGQHDELWLLQARDAAGRLAGIGPLMQVESRPVRGVCWRQIQFIGASSPCDHLDFIIEPGAEAEIIPAFLEKLEQLHDRWDVLSLSSMPSYSTNLALLEAGDLSWQKEETFVCPVINLPQDWDTLFESLGKSKRKHQRRCRRRLDEAYPNQWSCEMIEAPARVDQVLDEMICLHQAKWRELGKPGGFVDPNVIAFHHAIARRFLDKNWFWLYRLCIDGKTAAIEYAYCYRGRIYSFASGLNPDFTEVSPGQLLTEIMIRQAIKMELAEYDLLRGDEEYKFAWQAVARSDYTLRYVANPRARLEQRLIEQARTRWQFVKQALPANWRRKLVENIQESDKNLN